MPRRHWRLRVNDILACIDSTGEYVRGLDFETFRSDSKTIKAVIRDLTVIGEAATHVPDRVTARHPEIPWDDMWDMRNVVVHEYFGADVRIVWETALNDLPPLVAPLSRLLEAEQED